MKKQSRQSNWLVCSQCAHRVGKGIVEVTGGEIDHREVTAKSTRSYTRMNSHTRHERWEVLTLRVAVHNNSNALRRVGRSDQVNLVKLVSSRGFVERDNPMNHLPFAY